LRVDPGWRAGAPLFLFAEVFLFGCFGVFALAAGSAAAQAPAHVTRAQAIQEALARNPGLMASQEQIEQARAQVVVAGAFPDLTFSADVTGETHPFNPTSGTGSDQLVGVTVPFPGKIGMRRSVAQSAVRAAEFTLIQQRQQVASQAAQAYDALLVALRHREDLLQSREFASDFLEKTKARFQAGTVPKIDVVKAQVDVAQAENALIANERATLTARASLNRLLGRLGGAPFEPADSLEIPDSLPPIETLEQIAEASRPELKGLAAQVEGAQAATRLAKEFWAPDVSFTLEHNYLEGAPSSFTSGISFAVPLLFWQHQKGEVASARHREAELAANVADTRAQVNLDVRSAFAGASTALRQALFIRDELLPEAREVYRIAAASYGLGGSSALDLLDAKRTLVDAERQYVDALGAANDAEAALELAIGAPLPRTKTGDHS
jgi:cobalt-zinc-cadmium efflux system outer membrane protein